MTKLSDNFMLFEKMGFVVAPYRVVFTGKSALNHGDDIGYPVVLKISSDIHKKDVGGVFINIHNGLDMTSSWSRLKKNLSANNVSEEEFIIQKQIDGVELIVGLKEDPVFGPILLLGSGGTFAEVIKDVTFRACPITSKDAEDMIAEIKANKLLKGFRGDKPVNIKALSELLVKLSKLYQKIKFKEIDLNPVIVNEENAFLTDVRIINEIS